jgi:hypothetical protein
VFRLGQGSDFLHRLSNAKDISATRESLGLTAVRLSQYVLLAHLSLIAAIEDDPEHTSQPTSTRPIPKITFEARQSEWPKLLGHADFTIFPEPYVPQNINSASIEMLARYWRQAQNDYIRHLMDTARDFGGTSQYYSLTQQKWAEVHSQWMHVLNQVTIHGSAAGQDCTPLYESVQIDLDSIGRMAVAITGGKFPHVGDQGIVGMMYQHDVVSTPEPDRSRVTKFLRYLRRLF